MIKGPYEINLSETEKEDFLAREKTKFGQKSPLVRAYTKKVQQVQKDVENLDRIDDFDTLEIDGSRYRKRGGLYGIAWDNNIHIASSMDADESESENLHLNDSVILEHQLTAARKFLKERRGFGMLADVVGSGKTYEAGVVLSELAERGRIRNVLIVAPAQMFDTWVEVMEKKFGMGSGALYQVRGDGLHGNISLPYELELDEVLKRTGYTGRGDNEGYCHPQQSVIVDMDVFTRWKIGKLKVIFDAIVVDEAHHLCEDNTYASALGLLSQLMNYRIKDSDDKVISSYCLLLSATPHNGNLKKMFRLWYFITKNGGRPEEFTTEKHQDEYLNAKRDYEDKICLGAENVTEFVRKSKIKIMKDYFLDDLTSWLKDAGKHLLKDWQNASTDYAKDVIIERFLDEDKTGMRDEVERRIAAEYYSVLRTIMVRQPISDIMHKNKVPVNVFFFPVDEALYEQFKQLTFTDSNDCSITLDFTACCAKSNFCPNVTCDGKKYDWGEYIRAELKSDKDAMKDSDKNPHLVMQRSVELAMFALRKMNNTFYATKGVNYTKPDYDNYYAHRLSEFAESNSLAHTKAQEPSVSFVPVVNNGDHKYPFLKEILSKHSNSDCATGGKKANNRVIVFFDYDLPLAQAEQVVGNVVEKLSAEPEFKNRLVVADKTNKAEAERLFNEKSDAIFIAKDESFTEGANLQACSVVVNYAVTTDPLAMDQRIGRVFRLGQKDDVTIYSLADVNKLEGFALAYFLGIGLMFSNSGDATILAGSNNGEMITLRCPLCEHTKLMSKQDYAEALAQNIDAVMCDHDYCDVREEKRAAEPKMMGQISDTDFECDTCHKTIKRTAKNGKSVYVCMSHGSYDAEDGNPKRYGSLVEPANQPNVRYCSKLCAMFNCNNLRQIKCNVVEMMKRGMRDINSLDAICKECNAKEHKNCKAACRQILNPIVQKGDRSVHTCYNCESASCSPKPYVYVFDDEWKTDCNNCANKGKKGTIRQKRPDTFVQVLRYLWDYDLDNGRGFCQVLDKEAQKIEQIKRILSNDKLKSDSD